MALKEKTAKRLTIPIYNEQESFGDSILPGFFISRYKDEENEQLNRIDNHRHTYYEIIFITTGSGVHKIDFTDYSFSGPCLFLLHPQNVHKVHKDYFTKGGVIKFTSDFFNFENQVTDFLDEYEIFDDVDVLPVINLKKKEALEIETIFSLLQNEYQKPGLLANAIVAAILKVYLLKISEIKKKHISKQNKKPTNSINYKTFKRDLEKHFRVQHEVNYYAALLHISPKILTTTCKEISGKSASIVIKERILLEARRLLRYSNLSVKEISHQLGFMDEAYFTRFFTRNNSSTPMKYRKTTLHS